MFKWQDFSSGIYLHCNFEAMHLLKIVLLHSRNAIFDHILQVVLMAPTSNGEFASYQKVICFLQTTHFYSNLNVSKFHLVHKNHCHCEIRFRHHAMGKCWPSNATSGARVADLLWKKFPYLPTISLTTCHAGSLR